MGDDDLFRDDLTPGSRDSRFREPDTEFDYEEAAEDWDNDLAKAEAQVQAIEDEAVATAKSEDGKAEAQLKPLIGGKEPKRILLSEPENANEVDTLIRGIAQGDEFSVVNVLVDEPQIHRKRWDRQLTPLERGILYDLAYSFVRADELVDPRLIAELGRSDGRE